MNEASPSFPVQVEAAGCQQCPKGQLYTRNHFQGENIDLPVPSKTEFIRLRDGIKPCAMLRRVLWMPGGLLRSPFNHVLELGHTQLTAMERTGCKRLACQGGGSRSKVFP